MRADDSGQYGAAFRMFAPGLNETEFGFYYLNYHSRLPTINGRTGYGGRRHRGAGLRDRGSDPRAGAPCLAGRAGGHAGDRRRRRGRLWDSGLTPT